LIKILLNFLSFQILLLSNVKFSGISTGIFEVLIKLFKISNTHKSATVTLLSNINPFFLTSFSIFCNQSFAKFSYKKKFFFFFLLHFYRNKS